MSIEAAQFTYDMQTPMVGGERDTQMRLPPPMTADERLKDDRWQQRRAFFRRTGTLWMCYLPTAQLWDIAIDPGIRMDLGTSLEADARKVSARLRELADQIDANL